MPIDASIYGQLRPQAQLEGPLDQFGKAASIRNMLGAGQTQGLQQQLLREQIAGIPGERALAERKVAATEQTNLANLLKQDDGLVKSFSERGREELIGVTPQTWDSYRKLQMDRVSLLSTPQYREVALKEIQQMPEQYDPAWVQAKLNADVKPPAGHQRLPGGRLSEIDPNVLKAKTQVAAAGAPQVAVPIDMRAQSKFADKVGEKTAERIMGQHDSAENAVENLHKLNLTLQQINDSDAITGPGAEIFTQLERARQLVMADKKAGKRVSDTQLLDVLLGSDVFPMIKALGIGARGLDTPAEREFLRQVMTGVIGLNKDTLRRMTEIRRNVAVRAIEKWNKKIETGELDNYFKAAGIPKRKIEIPPLSSGARGTPDAGQPAAAAFQEGQTATGPNGEKIIFKGGQWQPVQ